ncbi:hypothetical protein KOW79_007681 [Hemibagrus wyckioides]|uniref:Chemokine interleukin-8-like domain-containing protein n=2 Tax=Hemibagrus wyckioides TaxID=337641 RepID=A0A9D3NZ10_9TELE|nr:hypothetical protein KOW79_007681 [Hemibagrus wyckioides]
MSRVFLVLGFVLIMALYSDAMPLALEHISKPESCCFDFFSGKIPKIKIQKEVKTGPNCAQRGVIVTTPKHDRLCVRP